MKIAFLTAGGIAPCLSASIGALIEKYNEIAPEAELIGYLNGYRGLLLGKSISFPNSIKKDFEILVVNDGSNDSFLKTFKPNSHNVIKMKHKKN